MQLLSYRNIKNTLVYTQLITFEDDDYIRKAAANVKEATELIEAGYEYVCDVDNVKLFRSLSRVYGFMLKSRGWELNPYGAALQAAASTVQPPRQY